MISQYHNLRPSVKSVANSLQPTAHGLRSGLSLIEILIAIGILAVSMMLIAAAFPAGVAMSIAVSDETTSQSVFQQALAVIRDNYSVSDIDAWLNARPGWLATHPGDSLPVASSYNVLPDRYLYKDSSNDYVEDDPPADGRDNRQYGDGPFSWSALIMRADDDGDPLTNAPMENLFHVIIVVSRKPIGEPDYVPQAGGTSPIPEFRSFTCTGTTGERILTVTSGFELLPSDGYVIDGLTGQIYSMISRNDDTNTATLLTPLPDDISAPDDTFWLVPGEYDGLNYALASPAVRVFQATLYLP